MNGVNPALLMCTVDPEGCAQPVDWWAVTWITLAAVAIIALVFWLGDRFL